MKYPKFFDEVKPLKLYDPLSEILGTFEDGVMEINYIDIVKFAGHSCPTVAGAYLMTQEALKYLYPNSLPVRGEIKVEFRDKQSDGVVGVKANVIENITGASDKRGFKGLNGKFARADLLSFEKDIVGEVRFSRVDNGKYCDIEYDPSSIPSNPKMSHLMQKMMQNLASKEEKSEFGSLWQDRVNEILLNSSKYPDLIKLSVL